MEHILLQPVLIRELTQKNIPDFETQLKLKEFTNSKLWI